MGYRPKCIYSQGTHCTKIGGKCVELRWFSHDCLMRNQVPLERPKPPVTPPRPFTIGCSRCDGEYGKCKHSKD